MPGTVVQHLFGFLQVAVLFPASALLLDYTLEQFPGEGYLGELQGRKEEDRYSQDCGPGIRLFVFGNEMFPAPAVNSNPFETWVGNGLQAVLCHSVVGPAKSHGITSLSVEVRNRGLGEFLNLCIQITHGGPFKLKMSRQGHSWEKARKLLTSLPVFGLSEYAK